jgi:DNA (cytosine-5)-methyltransferase 1
VKPRLLDLFCGAGGAAVGYHRAGFEVVGVDIRPQPRYPFEFEQHDALSYMDWFCGDEASPGLDCCTGHRKFDAIHASPPCQFGSTVTNRNRRKSKIEHPNLVPPTRELLQASGLPYVIENVEGVRKHLLQPTRICGSAFRDDLHRHRYFETNWPLMSPPCAHGRRRRQFRSVDSRMVKRGSLSSVIAIHGHLNYPGEFELRKQAMEIDWMTVEELNQAIPPAYTELIGHQLAQHIRAKEAA